MDLLGLFSFRKDEPYLPPNPSAPSGRDLRDFIARLGDLKPIRAKEVMTPRALVEGIDVDVEVARLHFDPAPQTLYFPVYEGDLDHIRGWIGQEKLRNIIHNGQAGNLRTDYVPAEIVSEDMTLDKAFLKFVKTSAPLFVVQNAAGITTGVLHLSEVLEVFFGLEIEAAPATISVNG